MFIHHLFQSSNDYLFLLPVQNVSKERTYSAYIVLNLSIMGLPRRLNSAFCSVWGLAPSYKVASTKKSCDEVKKKIKSKTNLTLFNRLIIQGRQLLICCQGLEWKNNSRNETVLPHKELCNSNFRIIQPQMESNEIKLGVV